MGALGEDGGAAQRCFVRARSQGHRVRERGAKIRVFIPILYQSNDQYTLAWLKGFWVRIHGSELVWFRFKTQLATGNFGSGSDY